MVSDPILNLDDRKVNLLDKRSRMVRNHAFVMMKVKILTIIILVKNQHLCWIKDDEC